MRNSKLTVFVAAVLALATTSAIGVAVGATVSQYVNERHLSWIASAGFIAVGVWTLVRA